MNVRLPRVATGVLLAGGLLGSALVFPELPERTATHWNAAGEVDGTMPRLFGAFALPAITVVLVPVLYLASRIDPDRENVESFRGPYEWFVAGFVAFMLSIHSVTLAWNLGYEFSFNAALAPAVGALLIGVGELMGHAERNWTIGVRTPWTLADEAVRAETHRHAAWAFRAAGVLASVGVVVPSLTIAFVLGGVLGAITYTFGYSYLAHRRRRSAG